MGISFQPYLICTLSFVGALLLSLVTVPRIIFIAKKKKFFDIPDGDRKIHTTIIPNLGGVAIFFAFMIITSLMIKPASFAQWNYFAAGCLILFVTGIKDDLITLPPYKKLISQFCAAFIIVFFADIRLTSLHGFLGIGDLPFSASVIFSVVGCMFMTNAFNLIDGIDGLAGTIGMISSFIFGMLLYAEGNYSAAVMSFSLMGAIGGFLWFNISPAKIFMGDTGSMLIGFSISVISILFIKSFESSNTFGGVIHTRESALLIALSVLFIPIFDTFRVFTTRSIKGFSPFRADRTHLHHYLLDLGLSHRGIVSTLLIANLFIMAVSLMVQDYNINLAIFSLLFVTFGLFTIVYLMRRKINNANKTKNWTVITTTAANGKGIAANASGKLTTNANATPNGVTREQGKMAVETSDVAAKR